MTNTSSYGAPGETASVAAVFPAIPSKTTTVSPSSGQDDLSQNDAAGAHSDSRDIGQESSNLKLENHSIVDFECVPAREVRVAVTMVGGTSLAIYESGVAQELFRMVHGQGLYGLTKRLTQSHAYIDILSGTSAGGINTICLSAALTTGTDFRPLRDVWVNLGGIDQLMQDPRDKRAKSLFRGNTYYLDKITEAFHPLCDTEQHVEWNRPGIPSGKPGMAHYTDLDLFVTGTYFDGQPRAFFDSRNQPIFTRDYAGVFHLKHRARRNESHFHPLMRDPETPPPPLPDPGPLFPWPGDAVKTLEQRRRRFLGVRDRLARVARTTSSLPGVFEPSGVDRSLMNGVIALPQNRRTNYMGDGGYLNNQPLNLVLREIFKRPAGEEVLRKVLFVEPVPAEPDNISGEVPEPSAIEHLWFYRDVPHRQSITSYLESIYQHNRKVSKFNETLRSAREMLRTGEPSEAQHHLWARLCLRQLRDQIIGLWENELGLGVSGSPNGDNFAAVESLRLLRTHLLARMEAACHELQRPEGSFSIQEVSASYFYRKIMRATEEIYRFLHPSEEFTTSGSDSHSTMPHQGLADTANGQGQTYHTTHQSSSTSITGERVRQDRYELIQRQCSSVPVPPVTSQDGERNSTSRDSTVHGRVRELLREMYHLRDLVEIIELNIGAVVSSVACSNEYEKATSGHARPLADINGDVDTLWHLMVGSIAALLEHLPAWPEVIEVPTSPTPPGTDRRAESQSRQQSNSQKLIKTLNNRSKKICADLVGGDKVQIEQRADYVTKGRNRILDELDAERPFTLLRQLDELTNRYLREVIEILEPALRQLQEAAPGAAANTPPPGEASPPVPLEWALEDSKKDNKITKAIDLGERIKSLDIFLLPIEEAAELECRSTIELIQISARDVQIGRSWKKADDKLAGDILGNSGGFLKRSWRANDILWGRLDASGALTDTLLERGRLVRLLQAGEPVQGEVTAQRVLKAITDYIKCGDACGPDNGQDQGADSSELDEIGTFLYPSYLREEPAIESWLMGVANERITGEMDGVEEEDGFTLLHKWVLSRHQFEILNEEVPGAIAEAIVEHALWEGRYGAAAMQQTQDSASEPSAPPSSEWGELSSQASSGPVTRQSSKPWVRQELTTIEVDLKNVESVRRTVDCAARAAAMHAAPAAILKVMEASDHSSVDLVAQHHAEIAKSIQQHMSSVPLADKTKGKDGATVSQRVAQVAAVLALQETAKRRASLPSPGERVPRRTESEIAAIIYDLTSAQITILPVASDDAKSHTNGNQRIVGPGHSLSRGLARLCGYQPDIVNVDVVHHEAWMRADSFFHAKEKGGRTQSIDHYFRSRYRIGQENVVDHIPALVTLHRVVSLLLIILHVTGNALPPAFKNSSIGKMLQGLFLRPLTLVIGGLYGFITILTQGSAAAAAAHAIAWSTIIIGLGLVFIGIINNVFPVLLAVSVAALFEVLLSLCMPSDLRFLTRIRWPHVILASLLVVGFVVAYVLGVYEDIRYGLALSLRDAHPLYGYTDGQIQTIAIRFGVGLFLTLGGAVFLGFLGRRAQTEEGGIVGWALARTPEASRAIKLSWDATARSYVALSLGLDFVFIIVYSCTLGFGCLWVSRLFAPTSQAMAIIGVLLAWGQCVAGGLDVIENISLLRMLFGPVTSRGVRVASFCATVKFILIVLGVLYLAAGFASHLI
jgi:predicted acylesterase/phospholipase RssA